MSYDMGTTYIVARPEYWASIPRTHELTCGRVRFTGVQCLPDSTAEVHQTKATAVAAAISSGRLLIREIQCSETRWSYQLLVCRGSR